ncbi:MAG: VWA domain-containing protein [Anaerolineales bacterium]|nr:VWA domain-containing protein [Anaerolineales bacterium]
MNTEKRAFFTLAMSVFLLIGACTPIRSIFKIPAEADGWVDWDGRGGWSESAAGSDSGLFSKGGEPAVMFGSTPAEAPAADALEADLESRTDQAGALRAGSVDDNQRWDDYLQYRLQAREWDLDVHDVDIGGRHVIHIVNEEGTPVLGAAVQITDEQGREIASLITPADGRALFFPAAHHALKGGRFELRASKDGEIASLTLDDSLHERTLVLNARSTGSPVRLDVLFLIDATGSMSDEIQQLKDNMIRVSERIDAFGTRPDVRFGMTIYRDRGDLFTSRTFDFTPDLEEFTAALDEVVAEGGGDYPESLNEGLHDAITLPEWRVTETISLVFLIADAPPHLDYPQDHDYAEDVFTAVERGIKIFPIASSGLDDQGEYIFRQLAQISGGKFLFLTYGAEGAPGDDTNHHVDDYSVLSLDDLVVRIVQEELTTLQPTQ